MKVTYVLPIGVILAALLQGCASHPKKMATIKSAVVSPMYRVNTETSPFDEKTISGKDKILFLSERARAYQFEGNLEKSSADYIAAEQEYEKLEEKPVVAISTGATKGIASSLLNDLIIPYEGNAHERIMLYSLDAFNHIANENWMSARASVNNIDYISEKELERKTQRDEAINEALEKDKRFTLEQAMSNASFMSNFKASDALTKSLESALQNGYAYYLSGFIKEMDGDTSRALVAYKKALEIFPQNQYIREDIKRLSSELGCSDSPPTPYQMPNVVVFFEEGFAPHLSGFSFSFTSMPVQDNASIVGARAGGSKKGAVAVAVPNLPSISAKFVLPYYSSEALNASPSKPLSISIEDAKVETQMVGDFCALAACAFKDRLPYIATRAAFRSILKATAAAVAGNVAAKRTGQLGQFAVWLGGFLFTEATEQPDLRSWLLAPRYGQVARFYHEPGERTISFSHGGVTQDFSTEIPETGTLFIHAISIPGRLIVNGVYLDR